MKCKPGDLAVIIKDDEFPENIGTFVTVVGPAPYEQFGSIDWECIPAHPIMAHDWDGDQLTGTASRANPGQSVGIADADLQPIRPAPEQQTDTATTTKELTA